MKKASTKGEVKVMGIDLAKQSFQLHGVDEAGRRVLQKRLSRHQLSAFVAQLPPCLIGLEACGSAHYWARVFNALGHGVRLMAPQFVKPYVKSNKNDVVDAEAICEAVQRPNMRFVPTKSLAQQDLQSLHRIRSQLIARRTAQSNQIRGLLLEYGLIVPFGISHVRKQLPLILEAADNGLSDLFRELLNELYEELVHLDNRVAALEQFSNDWNRVRGFPQTTKPEKILLTGGRLLWSKRYPMIYGNELSSIRGIEPTWSGA